MEATAVAERLADHHARIEGLERWQKQQNGTLQRLEEKIDRVMALLLCGAGTALLAVAGWLVVLIHK